MSILAKNKSSSILLIKILVLSFSLSLSFAVFAKNVEFQFLPEEHLDDHFMQIKNINSLGIANEKVDGLFVSELSGLAWDEGRQLLYAISDSGILYHIKVTVENNTLRKTKILKAYRLKDKAGRAFKGKYTDSEGLAVKYNAKGQVTELIISFERKFRIGRFNLQGKLLSEIKLPKKLRNKKNYQGKNKGLESVIYHPKYGYITAAERPLKNAPKGYQTLYSSKGKVWHFKPSAYKNISVTGLETLENGDILVLERAYSGLFSPMIIALRQVKLSSCNKLRQCDITEIATFNSVDGWRIDNFEGLAHYKGNQYLMVSDNNNNPLQSTALVMFEIK